MSFDQPTTAPSLDHAHYGIGPVEAVKRVYQKYATFEGRASRGEYWWFVLFSLVVYLVIGGLAGVLAEITEAADGTSNGAAYVFLTVLGIFVLGSTIPGIAVTVRRLHDAGYSGALYLINLVPYLGSMVLCVFLVMGASRAGDKYGPGPAGGYSGAPGQYGYAAPYAQPGYGQVDPYGQQADPYAQPSYGQTDPYGQQGYGLADPYAQPGSGQAGPYPHYPESQNDPYKPYP